LICIGEKTIIKLSIDICTRRALFIIAAVPPYHHVHIVFVNAILFVLKFDSDL